MTRGVTEHAHEAPDRVALIAPDAVGDTSRTYGELNERAQRLAAVLMERGAGPGRPVASAVRNGLEPFEVATAAAMAGAPFLPLNWHLKAAELSYLLDDSGAAVVVGHHDLAAAPARARWRACRRGADRGPGPRASTTTRR